MRETVVKTILRNDRIPLRLRKKVGKILGAPAPDMPFQIRLFEGVFEGKTGNHQDDKIFYYGSHEAATLRLMREILQKQAQAGQDPVYLDIGTNVGQHLVAVCPVARYAYGFEPWDKVRARALHNLAINNFQHAQVLPFGLSDQSADLPYFPPETENMGIGSFVPESENTGKPITLQVRKGDEVINELGIKPTLLKIDTEGFEANVLKGLQETLGRFRPAVIFELSDLSRLDFPTLQSIKAFFPAGYSIHGIRRSREMPCIASYAEGKKYENILAWPEEEFSL